MDGHNPSPLSLVPAAPRQSTLRDCLQLNRPALYEEVMRQLAVRVDAAHRRLVRDRDVLPELLPEDRRLTAGELDELTWRVYCLSTAMRLSLVRCHPTVVLLAAEWWGAQDQSGWEWFCQAHWP